MKRAILGMMLLIVGCAHDGAAKVETNEVVRQIVPQLRLGMPLDSAIGMLTNVRSLEYWGHVGTLPDLQNFHMVGVQTNSTRPEQRHVTEIHLFSPNRDIVARTVTTISALAQIKPRVRCSGADDRMVLYVWRFADGQAMLSENKAGAGSNPVHLWFIGAKGDANFTYELHRCTRVPI